MLVSVVCTIFSENQFSENNPLKIPVNRRLGNDSWSYFHHQIILLSVVMTFLKYHSYSIISSNEMIAVQTGFYCLFLSATSECFLYAVTVEEKFFLINVVV